MKNLKERIEIAYREIKESEDRKQVFIKKYIETGDSLYYGMIEDESSRILRFVEAIKKAEHCEIK